MAILSNTELADMRRRLREEWITPIDFTKPTINSAFQALEDEYERNTTENKQGFKLQGGADIVAAVSPDTFTNPELKKIGRAYLGSKHNMEAA